MRRGETNTETGLRKHKKKIQKRKKEWLRNTHTVYEREGGRDMGRERHTQREEERERG